MDKSNLINFLKQKNNFDRVVFYDLAENIFKNQDKNIAWDCVEEILSELNEDQEEMAAEIIFLRCYVAVLEIENKNLKKPTDIKKLLEAK